MATSNEILRGLVLQHELLIQRLIYSERTQYREVMSDAMTDLAERLRRIKPSRSRSKRLSQIKKYLKDTSAELDEVLTVFSDEYTKRLVELAILENSKALEFLERAVTVELGKGTEAVITPEIAETLVKETWINGYSVNEMFKLHKDHYINSVKQAVREGFLKGQSYEEIADNLSGYYDILGNYHKSVFEKEVRNADTTIRTTVLGIANTARNKMYDKNKKVLKGKMWVATLDLRTCTSCGNYDGCVWSMSGKSIQGEELPFEVPPLHPNCRCTLIPILKSWEDIDEELSETTRASMDGQVPANLTFDEWFEEWLTASEKEELIGKGRYELYKEHKLTYSDLIDQSGRGLTLAELKERYAKGG